MAKPTAEHPLAGKQFANKIADMADVNVFGIDLRIAQSRQNRVREKVEHGALFTRPIARKIRLRASENIGPSYVTLPFRMLDNASLRYA